MVQEFGRLTIIRLLLTILNLQGKQKETMLQITSEPKWPFHQFTTSSCMLNRIPNFGNALRQPSDQSKQSECYLSAIYATETKVKATHRKTQSLHCHLISEQLLHFSISLHLSEFLSTSVKKIPPSTTNTTTTTTSGSEDWNFPRIKIKPLQGLQMTEENIYHTTCWASFNLMDKVVLLPMNFSTGLFRIKVNLWLCAVQPPNDDCSSVLETAPVRINESYLLSLVPDQSCPGVVDGGQFRLRVLGKEERLLAPPKWGWGLPAQGTCRHPSWKGRGDTTQQT